MRSTWAGAVMGGLLLAGVLLASCSGDGPLASVPHSVVIGPRSLALLEGDTAELGALAYDARGERIEGQRVVWSTSAPGVVQVGSSGQVVALRAGSAWVSASAGKARDSVEVVVDLVTFVGAGDIARCDSEMDEATAALLDTIQGAVFTLGDNAYVHGSPADFANCYDPSWGRHKARTYPVPGNHEYETPNAAGYFAYFGERAGEPGKGYYAYTLGRWRVLALNSNIPIGDGSPQLQWVRSELERARSRCVLAYWHHPRFSSGYYYPGDPMLQPVWQVLYEHGADVVLSAHDHVYERFAPQTPAGTLDRDRGIRQFTVGTGGDLYGFKAVAANSEFRLNHAAGGLKAGVLKLVLHPDSYDWEFIAVQGGVRDSGSATCSA